MNPLGPLLVSLLLAASACHGGVVAGPTTNPANGHTYYLLSPADWDESEAEAVSLGGHLVTLSDAAEQDWVYGTFGSVGGVPRALWIGLTDPSQTGAWSWISGERLAYRHWAPGEPNNFGGDEDGVHLWHPTEARGWGGLWNDTPRKTRNTEDGTPLQGVVEVVPTHTAFLWIVFALALAVIFWMVYRRVSSRQSASVVNVGPASLGADAGEKTLVVPTCSRCGTTLTPNAPEGLCPRCLMALNLGIQTETVEIPAGAGGSVEPRRPLEAVPTPAEIARHFPQLEILECLGRGGMGVVYKARQTRLNRFVALKLLAPERKQDAPFARRFLREAQALARLNHPNIVGVYDFGEADGLCYLLMEFVDGVSLRHLLKSHRIAPEEALAIVPKVCEALQYAHDHGIVHRDIKPENILLDQQRQVKIADFGIAKLLGGDQPQPAITLDQQVIGTPHYMAPEQVEHPHLVDHRADIYSLGVVFYELLTGELPLGQFQPPSKKAHVDRRLDGVVLGTLAKEPDRRYQQASAVKTDVETIATTPGPVSAVAPAGVAEVASEAALPLSDDGPPVMGVPTFPAPSEGSRGPDLSLQRARLTAAIAGLVTTLLLLGIGGLVWKWPRSAKETTVAKEVPAAVEPGPAGVEAPPPPAQVDATKSQGIPPRDPQAGRNLIDLSAYYTTALDENWSDPVGRDNHLGELPTGLQTMAGTLFDVRGLIAVEKGSDKRAPLLEGIPINQKCQRLHFLHSAANAAFSNGEEIGRYVVHLANGEEHVIPIVTGRDVVDWHKQIPEGSPPVIAWEGDNAKTRRRGDGRKIHLFKSTWDNPSPGVEVQTIDFEGLRHGPAPFLVALTAE